MTEEQLAEIEARANAALEGPWVAENAQKHLGEEAAYTRAAWDLLMGPAMFRFARVCGTAHRTLKFIAAARTDVPRLIAEVRAGRAENASLRTAMSLTEGTNIIEALHHRGNRVKDLEAENAAKDARIEFLEKALGEARKLATLRLQGDSVWALDRDCPVEIVFTLAAWLREQSTKKEPLP